MFLYLCIFTIVVGNSFVPTEYCQNESDPCHDFCESFARNHERVKEYVRLFHKMQYIPYDLKLSEDSYEIGAGLILSHVNCFDQGLKRINGVAVKLEHDKQSLAYKSAIWAKAKILAELGQYDEKFYKESIESWQNLQNRYPEDAEPGFRIGEILMMMGKNGEAIYPLSEAANKDPTNVEIRRVRGSLFFLEGNYEQAASDFNLAVKYEQTPELLYYQGLSLYHIGKLDEAIRAFDACEKLRTAQPEVLRIHAQALKDIGNFEKAQQILKQAHTIDQRNAKTLKQKGKLFYDAGKPFQAYRDLTRCASLEPWNMECLFYKSLSSLNVGKFYQGIKDLTTKVLLNTPLPGEALSLPFIRSFYLREWTRYIHWNLDHSTKLDQWTFNPEKDLSEKFRMGWINNEDSARLNLKEWNEGLGISSSIPDVNTLPWANLPRDYKLIVCQAGHLGTTHRSGFELQNTRRDMAIGMAAIEIYQSLIDRQYKDDKKPIAATRRHWKDAVNIAIKWLRLVDLNEPIFSLENFSGDKDWDNKILYHQYKERIPFTYQKYARKLLMESRLQIMELPELRHLKDKIKQCESISELILLISQSEELKVKFEQRIYSFKEKNEAGLKIRDIVAYSPRKMIPGPYIELVDEGFVTGTTSAEGEYKMSAKLPRNKPRFLQINSELDSIWKNCKTTDAKGNDQAADIAFLFYYYYTLMSPLTAYNSEIGFSVTLGLLMGMGRTVRQIPDMFQNTVLYLEILKANKPHEWVLFANDLYEVKFHPPESFQSLEFTNLIKIDESIGTMRRMIEVLNHDYTRYCCNGLPIL